MRPCQRGQCADQAAAGSAAPRMAKDEDHRACGLGVLPPARAATPGALGREPHHRAAEEPAPERAGGPRRDGPGRADRSHEEQATHVRRVSVRRRHLEQGANPRFIVTDLPGSPKTLYERRCCARGEAQNPIKEAQPDLFGRCASCHRYQVNQLRLLLAALAYTLMINLHRLALKGTKLAQACTMRRINCHTHGPATHKSWPKGASESSSAALAKHPGLDFCRPCS